MSEITWQEAIVKVLMEAGGALHYQDITERILSKKIKKSVGATPHSTVAAKITSSIKHDGIQSPFVKVAKGTFALREQIQSTSEEQKNDQFDEVQYEVISSFGMFWRRDSIEWNATPKILGFQQIEAKPVNFYEQLGIYLLYDNREVIYVGRATERPLGKRLYEHTIDRLSTRWDRFSWFGFLPVSEEGVLKPMAESYQAIKIIPALEAILVEALEPRQNRKRGDDLSAVEYFQKDDPEIQKKKMKQMLDKL
ncbi:MAG: HTH domain-containing protein [bacterium]